MTSSTKKTSSQSSSPAPPPQNAHTHVLGVDVSKLTLDVCLLDSVSCGRKQFRFANTAAGIRQLLAWLRKQAGKDPITLALESTGIYGHPCALAAHAAGHRVFLVNARRVVEFARSQGRRNKTDKADAELIARFALANPGLPRWEPLPPAQATLRALLRRQADLEAMVHAEQRRLESCEPVLRASIQALLEAFQTQLQELEKAITAHLRKERALANDVLRLRAVPGIGLKTARLLVAEIPRHFKNARAIAAWLGVVPRQYQSGSSVRKASRIGREAPHLRFKLYFPAITAMRFDPRCKAFASRLRAAGKAPLSVVFAVLHKLIRMAFAMLKTGSEYQPDHHVALRADTCSP